MTDIDDPRPGPSGPTPAISPEKLAELIVADRRCLFGPMFFLRHLGAMVRDRCPDPSERLPSVSLWLSDGRSVEVCHIEMISPRWVALAIRGASPPHRPMPLLLVPYETITRVQIGEPESDTATIGFDATRRPQIVADTATADSDDAPRGAGADDAPSTDGPQS